MQKNQMVYLTTVFITVLFILGLSLVTGSTSAFSQELSVVNRVDYAAKSNLARGNDQKLKDPPLVSDSFQVVSPKPVVLVTLQGWRWDLIDLKKYPHTHSLFKNGYASNLVIRTKNYRTCPIDAYLTLSAQERLSWQAEKNLVNCSEIPPTEAKVSALKKYFQRDPNSAYGNWGDELAKEKITTAGIGRGARLALQSSQQDFSFTYRELKKNTSATQTAQDTQALLDHHSLIVIDPAESISEHTGSYQLLSPEKNDKKIAQAQAKWLEEYIQNLGHKLDHINLWVASLSDGDTAARLQGNLLHLEKELDQENPDLTHTGVLAPVVKADLTTTGTLYSTSTRKSALIINTDITKAITAYLSFGAKKTSTSINWGNELELINTKITYDQLEDRALHGAAGRTVRGIITFVFVSLVVLIIILVPWTWKRHRRIPTLSKKLRFLKFWKIFGLWVAAILPASFLINLFPWWRPLKEIEALTILDLYSIQAVISTLALAALLSGLALLLKHFTQKSDTPVFLLLSITTVALGLDPVLGSKVPLDSPIATASVFGSRFYGIGNTHFAVLFTSGLYLSALISDRLREHKNLRITCPVLIGLALTIIDASPAWGSDLGGAPGLLLAFAILLMPLLGYRLQWRNLLAILTLGALAMISILFIDWLRPIESQSHLGKFFQKLLDGQAWPIVVNKLSSMLLADGWKVWHIAILATAGMVVLLFAYLPLRTRDKHLGYRWLYPGGRKWDLREVSPSLPLLLRAWTGGMIVSTLINDSLILIPLIGAGLLIPALVSQIAGWLYQENLISHLSSDNLNNAVN